MTSPPLPTNPPRGLANLAPPLSTAPPPAPAVVPNLFQPPRSFPRLLDDKQPPQGITTPITTTPALPGLASATPVYVTATTNTPPAQDILATQDAPPEVIHRTLIKSQVFFYFAYGLSCLHVWCKYLHETSDDVSYVWYFGSVSSNTSWATIATILHIEETHGPQDYHDPE